MSDADGGLRYRIALIPGDGIGPEVVGGAQRGPRGGRARVRRRVRLDGAPGRRHRDRRVRRRVPRRGPRRVPRGRRRAARRRRRPQVGQPRRHASAPSRRSSTCATASACSRTCGRSPSSRRSSTPRRSARSCCAASTCLIVRELTAGLYFGRPSEAAGDRRAAGPRSTRSAVHRARDPAHRRAGVRAGARPARQGHERRQGQRPRDLPAVAHGRPRRSRRIPRRRPRPPPGGLVPRCSSSRSPASFDVLVTENLFGDILSDEAAC